MTWRVQVTLPTSYIGWIERQVAAGRNRSKLFQQAIELLIEETKYESDSVREVQSSPERR
jgi:Arc/MetJ-type ribon-helix-helix transcriptional regulator